MWGWLGKRAVLTVKIVRITDDSTYPVFVEAEVHSFQTGTHRLVDKLPIFTDAELSLLPMPGEVHCTIVEEGNHGHLGPIFLVDTEEPHHVCDENGKPLRIWVEAHQLDER